MLKFPYIFTPCVVLRKPKILLIFIFIPPLAHFSWYEIFLPIKKNTTASALHIPKVSFATSSRASYHDINQATEFTFSSSKNLFLKLKLTYLGPKYLRGK